MLVIQIFYFSETCYIVPATTSRLGMCILYPVAHARHNKGIPRCFSAIKGIYAFINFSKISNVASNIIKYKI
jgi:hypothetical protein